MNSGAVSRGGRPGAELLHEGEEIGYAPMLGDLAIAHPHDIDGLELNLPARRRHAQKFSAMRPVIGLVCRHAVPIGKLPMNFGVKVGECGAQCSIQVSRACLVGRAVRLWGMVKKIVGKELFEHFEIPTALHFFGIAANDCFRGRARTGCFHLSRCSTGAWARASARPTTPAS
jgi:hypothetical protein